MNPDLYGYTLESADEYGNTYYAPDIYLSPSVCYALKLFSGGRPVNPYRAVTAVLTLEHEVQHIVLNSGDEGVVECNAMLHINQALRTINPRVDIKRFNDYAWIAHWDSPPEYLTDPVCRTHVHDKMIGIGPVKKKVN